MEHLTDVVTVTKGGGEKQKVSHKEGVLPRLSRRQL